MFDGPQVQRAFSSRKVTIAKRSCFADWKGYVKRRKRAAALLRRNIWDSVTRAFYRLMLYYDAYVKRKRLKRDQGRALVRCFRPKARQLMRLALGNIAAYARTASLVIKDTLRTWKVWHIQRRRAKHNLLRLVKKHTKPRLYFRHWLAFAQAKMRFELTQSSVKIFQTMAAGNLAMTYETIEKRKLVMMWKNITIGKAFRIWKQVTALEHDNADRKEELIHHMNLHLKRKVFSSWHRHILIRRAGALALGRCLKRSVQGKMRRRLDIWHNMTVQHTKRKKIAIESLFKISRTHMLRHTVDRLRKAAFERRSLKAIDIIKKQHAQASEEVRARES